MTEAPIADPLLVVDGLAVELGRRQLLRDLSFAVASGELAVVRGPNGSGKTTLLRAILGELPHRGTIHLAARDGETARVGLVPQTFAFDPSLPISVADFFALTGGVPAFLRRRADAAARDALDRVGGASLMDRLLGELSGGEMRRVLLAHSLAGEPDLLLLDEPANHLDDAGVALFDQLLLDLGRERRLTMLAVVHGASALVDAADRLIEVAT